MLIGAGATWHGIDRLIHSLENYKGEKRITIDVIGSISSTDLKMINESNVKNHINLIPSVTSFDLNTILNHYHIGIGTLAVYKLSLIEATPLKTREYFARGFPILIGYKDTDIVNHTEFQTYCYEVTNDDTLIDMENVFEFVKHIYVDNYHPQKIRELAFKYLDAKVKMVELLTLLN